MPKILIGIPTQEGARHSCFYDYYHQLDRPDGTLHMFARGQSPAKNRNLLIEAALSNECTHILFLDDDVVPPVDILEKLLRHDKDVVTGLYPMRNFPHFPIIFDKAYDNGYNKHVHLKDNITGLIPITNCGLGCVLIKTEVFRSLKTPWITLGEIEKDGWCDDIAFFNKVIKAGFEMYCDTEVIVDHMMSMHVGFRRVNDRWMVNYNALGTGNLQFPLVYPECDIDQARTIDGWMSEKELEFLGVSAKSCNLTIEVGAFKGRSTRALADNTYGKVISIDTWNSKNFAKNEKFLFSTNDDIYVTFQKNLEDHISSGKVIPYRMKFEEFELNGYQPDFVFIDGAHDYVNVKKDIEKALGMKPKVLAGHDYDFTNWPDVVKAVNERFPAPNIVGSIWWVEVNNV